jgi:hypothetical protein
VNRRPSDLWLAAPRDPEGLVRRLLDAGHPPATPVPVFFRADDVAVPGAALKALLDLFTRHRRPLNLAVVPAWLTHPRWRTLQGWAASGAGLWYWHQHGWRHANHEAPGVKPQEFGPGRPPAAGARDLAAGRRRLEAILGAAFTPVFTPPWNRCRGELLEALSAQGYAAVSRGRGAQPPPPPGLPDLAVNVDLHTRKEPTPAAGWRGLEAELAAGLARGVLGFMIHHQRMNAAAFVFLDRLLSVLGRSGAFEVVGFPALAGRPAAVTPPGEC